jgi:hypothetical protein
VSGAAALALACALAAAPELRVEGGVDPEAAAVAARAWGRLEEVTRADGLRAPAAPRPIRIVPSTSLPPGVAAASRPGVVALRPGVARALAGAGGDALRHELAHQFLLEACPPAQGDRLFHEAFAMSAGGELAAWARGDEGRYLPLAHALEQLERAHDLDAPGARRAIARLLVEAPAPAGRLAPVLARRLGACDDGARWTPLRPAELAGDGAPAGDALVVLSRHSGETLVAEGAAAVALPFGSTLKPFLVAGAPGATPVLAPAPDRPGWRCGENLPARMDAATALLRSCNGWFLDWAARDATVVRFGPWGPVLEALGLSGLPADAAEAIGVRPTLRIPPAAVAEAYRLLAEARPDLVDVLSRNAREGTLAAAGAAPLLEGVAAKTGTVLDPAGNPRLGWIVAMDRDVVVVMTRAGRTPRAFAAELAGALARARSPAREAARVQTFGLVGAERVRARCGGRGVVITGGVPALLPDAEVALLEAPRAPRRPGPLEPAPPRAWAAPDAAGPADPARALVCAGGPWRVRLPGATSPRTYAGTFVADPAPARAGGEGGTERERNARRGSDVVFRTTRLAYAAGVVAAEDAAARGEARIALARVADANAAAAHARHAGRPVCDTTHCQAFLGTVTPGAEERRALSRPLPAGRWRPFARGGAEAWREERPAEAAEAALGAGARGLRFAGGRVSFVTSASDGAAQWEERREVPCELLRGPLRLPSCPERATARGGVLVFEGRGRGHGEGLDVEWAKRSGLDADRILEAAYGRGERAARAP